MPDTQFGLCRWFFAKKSRYFLQNKKYWLHLHHQNGYVRIIGTGDLVAQQVEHNTFNVGVLGSSPSGITFKRQPKQKLRLFCFVVVVSCASAHTHYKTNTGIAGLSLSLGIIIRVARIIMLYFQQYPRECFALRAPAGSRKRGAENLLLVLPNYVIRGQEFDLRRNHKESEGNSK